MLEGYDDDVSVQRCDLKVAVMAETACPESDAIGRISHTLNCRLVLIVGRLFGAVPLASCRTSIGCTLVEARRLAAVP
jgi:hypothetical protein